MSISKLHHMFRRLTTKRIHEVYKCYRYDAHLSYIYKLLYIYHYFHKLRFSHADTFAPQKKSPPASPKVAGRCPKLLVPPGHGFGSFADVRQGWGVEGFRRTTLEIEDKKLGLNNLGGNKYNTFQKWCFLVIWLRWIVFVVVVVVGVFFFLDKQ